jgi:gamma-glutamylcyclotransferase (GGCT)/AIG2-like uncharacterized protein YtfP
MLKDTLLLCDGDDCTYAINLKNRKYPECDIINDNKIYDEIFNKAQALIDNLDELQDFDIEKGSITADGVDRIEIDVQNQLDEFFIYMNEKRQASESIEVVTKEIAESNDKDWLSCYGIDDYRVGEVNSDYKKLGDSEYYYRFL